MIYKTNHALREDAENALKNKRYRSAHKLIMQMLQMNKDDAYAFVLMSTIAQENGNIKKAVDLLKRAVSLAPNNYDYPVHLAKCFALEGNVPNTVKWAQKSFNKELSSAYLYNTLGVAYTRIGDHEKAKALFLIAVYRDDTSADYFYNLGASQRFLGHFDAAKISFTRATLKNPKFSRAHIALASLNSNEKIQEHRKTFLNLLKSARNNVERLSLSHALASNYEKTEQYTLAFKTLKNAKQARIEELGYSFEEDAELFDAITRVFAKEDTHFSAGFETDRAIFIAGMPRSGTTLVERIISGHDGVKSLGELHNLELLLKNVAGINGAKTFSASNLETISNSNFKTLGKAYMSSVKPLVDGKTKFIDKLPLNILFAGFIIKALPQSKIVCLSRHPLDTIMSNYRQVFSANYKYCNYSLDLISTTKFYIAFRHLVNLWQRLFPNNFYLVNYERLVTRPEEESKKIANFCEIPWQKKSLQIYKNMSAVATASSLQVRQKINTSSIGRWQKYEIHLSKVIDILKSENLL